MNSKKNFKRVTAGALAVLTVAGTMPTNVLFDSVRNVIVADAAAEDLQAIYFGSADTYLTYMKAGNKEYNEEALMNISSFRNIPVDSEVIIVSKIPLVFNKNVFKASEVEGGVDYSVNEKLNDDNTYTYTFKLPKDADGLNSKRLTLSAITVGATLLNFWKEGEEPNIEEKELLYCDQRLPEAQRIRDLDVRYIRNDKDLNTTDEQDVDINEDLILDSVVRVSATDPFILRIDNNSGKENIIKYPLNYSNKGADENKFFSDFVVPENATYDEQWEVFRDENKISFHDIRKSYEDVNSEVILDAEQVEAVVKAKWIEIIEDLKKEPNTLTEEAFNDRISTEIEKEFGDSENATIKNIPDLLVDEQKRTKWSDYIYVRGVDQTKPDTFTVVSHINDESFKFKQTYSDKIKITVEKTDLDDAVYTVDGDKLLISSEKASISNLLIAKITATVGENVTKTRISGGIQDEYTVFVPDRVQTDDGKDVLDENNNPVYVTVANGESVPNGKAVKVTYEPVDANSIFFKEGSVVATSETYNGVDKPYDNDGDPVYDVGSYSFTATYTAPGEDDKKYTITKNFGIAAKTALDASSLNLDIYNIIKARDKDGKEITDSNNNGIKDDVFINTDKYPIKGVKNGVAKFITNDEVTSIQQFTVQPSFPDELGLKPSDYKFEGELSGSTMNNEYEFTVYIYNPIYGGSATDPKTFKVKWMVKSNQLDPHFDFPKVPFEGENAQRQVRVSLDNLEVLGDEVFEAAGPNKIAKRDRDQYTFGYVEGKQAGAYIDEDELDEYIDGLPTAPGSYKIYILRDGEKVASVATTVTAYSLEIVAEEEDFVFTYGDSIKDTLMNYENYVLVDEKSGDESDTVTATITGYKLYKAVYNEEAESYVIDTAEHDALYVHNAASVKAKDDAKAELANKKAAYEAAKAAANGNEDAATVVSAKKDYDNAQTAYNEAYNLDPDFYPAGAYKIEFTAQASDDTYTIVGVPQDFIINKKKLTKDMIVFSSINYNGVTQDIVKQSAAGYVGTNDKKPVALRAFDKVTGDYIDVTAYEGPAVSAIGKYNASVKIADNATDEMKNNYEGEVKDANWYIVPNEIASNAGLKFKEDAKSIVTDNETGKVKLSVTLTRNKNSDLVAYSGANQGKLLEIAEYGIIYDDQEKIAVPADYNNQDIEDANDQLVYGGAFKKAAAVGKHGPTSETYNLSFKSGYDVGWWVRPYIKYKDGTVSYGSSVYYNLGEEAKSILNLKMNAGDGKQEAVRRADNKELEVGDARIMSGYNPLTGKTYLYANFTDLEKLNKKSNSNLEVSNFGVVVDKNGLVTDAASAKEKLVVDYDYKKNNNPIITGQYSKTNTQLKVNEYAANVAPVDGVTGVWARPYLDLGDGFVVYGDAVYFESATEFFKYQRTEGENDKYIRDDANAHGVNLPTILEHKNKGDDPDGLFSRYTGMLTAKLRINQTSDKHDDIAHCVVENKTKFSSAELVKVGVVVDKYGKLNNSTTGEVDMNLAYKTLVAGKLDESGNKMFASGAKASGFDNAKWLYTGSVTPKAKEVAARAYAVYRITDTAGKTADITIYGDIIKLTQPVGEEDNAHV